METFDEQLGVARSTFETFTLAGVFDVDCRVASRALRNQIRLEMNQSISSDYVVEFMHRKTRGHQTLCGKLSQPMCNSVGYW